MNKSCSFFMKYVSLFLKKSDIPKFYLIRLYVNRVVSLSYGCIRLLKWSCIFIHPTCVIKGSSKLKMGQNITISRNCYIDALSNNGLIIGDNVYIGQYTTIICTSVPTCIGKGIKVGNGVSLGSHGYYGGAGGVEIGDFTIFGNYVSVHPENHNYMDINIPICKQGVTHKGIKIGTGCWIGAKATILDGTMIGNHVVVAAGAVVTGCFPDNVVIGGVPAKIIKWIEK